MTMSPLRRITDRWFSVCSVVALVALAATAASLASGIGAWRVPFVAAHLATLLALTPLGVVLAVEAVTGARREAGSLAGIPAALVRRQPVEVELLVVLTVAVAVSLANFAGGTRWLRAGANLVSVAAIVTLVARYLRAGRASQDAQREAEPSLPSPASRERGVSRRNRPSPQTLSRTEEGFRNLAPSREAGGRREGARRAFAWTRRVSDPAARLSRAFPRGVGWRSPP